MGDLHDAQRLRGRIYVLLGHLLKWEFQPELCSKSWFYTIQEQRQEIRHHLQENPSLKPYLAEAIAIGYEKGLNLVGRDTPIDPRSLPQTCPYTQWEILDALLELG